MTGPGAVPLELVRALRQRHLRLLAELLLPGAVGYLVTDFALEPSGGHPPRKASATSERAPAPSDEAFLGTSPQELCALVSKDAILRTQVRQLRLSPSWLWRQNPRRTLRVCAIQFQRNREATGPGLA